MENLDPQIEGYINRFSEAETLEEMRRIRDEVKSLLKRGVDSFASFGQAKRLEEAMREKIDEIRARIEKGVQLPVKPTVLDEVFVPPDPRDLKIGNGNGSAPLEEKALFPRTQLAFEVLQNLGVPIMETVSFYEGRNADNMLRGQSYRSIVVPTLNKTILVCDEEGNRTFVVHTADMAESFTELSKDELKEITTYGMVSDLVWGEPEEWKLKLAELLQLQDQDPKAPSPKESEKEILIAPEGWMNNFSLAKALGVARQTIFNIANQYRESNPEWFRIYRPIAGGGATEYYDPILVERIKK
jgi:hypothetical protein